MSAYLEGDHVPVDYSQQTCNKGCCAFTRLFNEGGRNSRQEKWYADFGPERYFHDGRPERYFHDDRDCYNANERLGFLKFPPAFYRGIDGKPDQSQGCNQKPDQSQGCDQLLESEPHWRNCQIPGSDLGSHFEGWQVEQSLYDIKKKKKKKLKARNTETDNNMALKNGKKLCKLDAICAKLTKINTDSSSTDDKDEDREVPNDSEKPNGNFEAEEPTDLSVKCLNNNIIGKIDLHKIESYREESECLDLTKSRSALENGDKTEYDNTNIPESSEETREQVIDKTENNFNTFEQIQHSKSGFEKISNITPVPMVSLSRPKITPVPVGSSRRKSRKAATPRNITQVRDVYDPIDDKDELAEYKINNQNTNFPPDDCYENESEGKGNSASGRDPLCRSNDFVEEDSNSSIFNLSKSSNYSKRSSLNHSRESRKSLPSSDFEGAPLDLSINKSNDGEESFQNGDLSSDDDDDFFHPDRNLVIDEDKLTISKSELSVPNSPKEYQRDSVGEQAAHLKDYAESTMNELISMYGFGGSGHSNDLSIRNFSTILQQAKVSQLSSLTGAAQGGAIFQNQPINSEDDESHDGSLSGKSSFATFGHSESTTPVKGEVSGSATLKNDRFTSSSSFINALYGSSTGQTGEQLSPGKTTLLPNYSKYLKRYNSGGECGGQHCLDLSYKEHYHCIDCSFQVFIKKEEMVRHYKWHKKREESLQHGFLRFSPLDNCTKKFGPCTHNGKQTHYHCLQSTCDKVYISTSDVQMHANYHRKDSAIMSEGFQRFRATEDCGTLACAFYGQRTTHFHCLRSDCKFTFKNKADMEKHKSYHQKDEVLGRDGFKKFMKYEQCMYQTCRYSNVSNHIHCIRSGCDYVLHSTAQLYSHKRKHERRDFENAYKRYRDTHQPHTPQPIQPANNQIQTPRNFSSIGQIPTSVIQSVASLTGIKRLADHGQIEPLELKKPKLEPGSDTDALSPEASSARSTPIDKGLLTPKREYESMGDDDSIMSETSAEKRQPSKFTFDGEAGIQKFSFDNKEGINLNSSLTLPIPRMANELALASASLPTQIQHLKPNISGTESFSSLNSSMPGTLTGALVTMNPGTLMTVRSSGLSTALQPPKSVYTERREKDDSWKTYLVRYTANDPCNPRCQYLYKDHYHCKIDGCLVLFKSKDGVREHARFHELQDRITPIAYRTYGSSDACPDTCQYSETEKHFHCIWTGCTHVVPYVGPTFGRLEHYRIHEYARAAAGKSYSRSPKGMTTIEDNSMRRRGRPPKYPKMELPKIPKVELTDEEIRQSHIMFDDSEISTQTKVVNGFRIFSPEDPCPDDQCTFIGSLHYHCARPRCFTITDRTDVLNLHAKDFHSFVKIMEGFEFFDRNVSCRRLHCPNNQTNRHFHCTRPKCDYSFIRHSTMAQHDKKHLYADGPKSALGRAKLDLPTSPTTFRRELPIMPANISSIMPAAISTSMQSATLLSTQISQVTPVITSTGTLIPFTGMNIPLLFSQQGSQLSGMPRGSVIIPQQTVGVQPANLTVAQVTLSQNSFSSSGVPLGLSVSSVQALPASITSPQHASTLSAPLITASSAAIAVSAINNSKLTNSSAPLTVLLQRGVNQIPQPSWNDLKTRMHYAISQNCGRPFCKLKKKDHFHCYDCNQAFSDPARLRSHIGKHGIKIKRQDQGDMRIASSKLPLENEKKLTTTVEGIETEVDQDEAKCLAEGAEMTGDDSDADDELKSSSLSSSSLNLNPSTFSEMISKAQEQNKMSPVMGASSSGDETKDDSSIPKLDSISETDGNQSDSSDHKIDISSRSGRKITKTKHEGFMNSGEINLSKGRRGSSPRSSNGKVSIKINDSPVNVTSPKISVPVPMMTATRGIKDDSIPNGYSRWRYNEECCYAKCAYRHSVTHFHCIREDCGYGFSDRSRLVQHSLRHERIDSITGGELQQYRINQDCENVTCEHNKKMSHFHCKRCPYCCTDSSKVLTHRKYHAKLDNIANQGFQKYSAADDCSINICPYSRKQNHFHCLVDSCKAAVLGPAQMTSHKVKHSADSIADNEDS